MASLSAASLAAVRPYTPRTSVRTSGLGLGRHGGFSSLALPTGEFARGLTALRAPPRRRRSLTITSSAAGEIFKIAAIMNGLTLVGVAVGFVLLRIEAWVEESEAAD